MKKKLIPGIAFLMIASASSLYANHPSFDCSKVEKNSTEGVICSSDELMDLDRDLSAIYKKARKKAKASDHLKAHQFGWLRGRNECWKDKDEKECIKFHYEYRIKELKKKYLK